MNMTIDRSSTVEYTHEVHYLRAQCQFTVIVSYVTALVSCTVVLQLVLGTKLLLQGRLKKYYC